MSDPRPQLSSAVKAAALAGRRIDAADAPVARFPLAHRAAVTQTIAALLREEGVGMLVSSAACGADLCAIEAARSLRIACGIVLPFPPDRFRTTSVVDRPGAWGADFDRAIDYATATGFVHVVSPSVSDDAAYARANEAIVAIAATAREPLAIVAWEGRPRGDDDLTAHFLQLAQAAGFASRIVLTSTE